MSQQINLLNPMLRPRRIVVSAARVALSLVALLLLLAAVHAYEHDDVTYYRRELQSVQDKVAVYRQSVEKMKKASAPATQSALEAEIAKLQAELKLQQDNMAALQQGALGDRSGFSEYLRAFSRQTVNGLWLTAFTIAGGGGDITLRGRVTNAALLPDYIQRLSKESVLKGRSFAAFEMRRPEPPKREGEKEEPRTPRTAPYLDFRLASTEAMPGAGAARRERIP